MVSWMEHMFYICPFGYGVTCTMCLPRPLDMRASFLVSLVEKSFYDWLQKLELQKGELTLTQYGINYLGELDHVDSFGLKSG
jgi:hypothetical protein